MHRKLSQDGIDILSRMNESSKIVLYGSVFRGNYRADSDIDIAFICDDIWKGFPLDMEGIPMGLRERISQTFKPITDETGIVFHVPVYWNSEFEKGIELYSGRKSPPDLLHNVGSVVYDAYFD